MDLVYQNPTKFRSRRSKKEVEDCPQLHTAGGVPVCPLCVHTYVVFIGEHNPLVLLRLYINKWHVAHLQEHLSILTVSDAF